MFDNFLAEFTPYRLLVSAISTIILTGLARAVMWLFRINPRKEWAYWVIGFLFVFAATIALAQIVNPARPEDRPDLSLSIDDIRITELQPPGESPSGLVLLVATVRNRGQAATTAEGFSLDVKVPGGNTFTGNRVTIPQRGRIVGPNGREIWLSSDDALDRKTAGLIPRGAHVRGRLVYLFEKLRAKDLETKGNTFTLTITDNWGKRTATTLSPGEFSEKVEIRDFPGMRSQSELQRPDVIPETKK